jgi:glycosyltransferase involved in cell wall biosynthesis
MTSDFTVVIPAYESASTIGIVVRDIRAAFPGAFVIVVDDGSRDETGREAGLAGAEVLSHPRNKGVGSALKTGFSHAICTGAETIVTIGADRQRDVLEIQALLDALAATGVDCVVGSKYLKRQPVPISRRIGGQSLGGLFNLLFGRRETDVLSGFRAIRAHCLREIEYLHDGYPFDVDLRIHFLKQNASLLEIPVTVYYPPGSTRMRYPSMVGLQIAWRIVRGRFS